MQTRYPKLMAALAIATLSLSVARAQNQDGNDVPGREAHRSHHGPQHGFGNEEQRVARLAKRLDLDDRQTVSIKNILAAARPEFERLRSRARTNHEAVRELDPGDADYATALQDVAAANGELATDFTLLSGRIRGEVFAELTPEQQAKLADRVGWLPAEPWSRPRRRMDQ